MRDDHHLEERLRTAEERLRRAEAASGIGIFDLDLVTLQWDWTAQLAELFGIAPQSASSSFVDWEAAILAEDVPKLHAALQVARQGGAFQVEFRVRHPDDSMHWISGRATLAQKEGEPTQRLRGVFQEITDRKLLEVRLLGLTEMLEARAAERARELNASATQIEETERRFRLLVEAVIDYAVFMLDPDGRIVSWNPGAQRIKGYSQEEIIGEHFSRFYTETDRENGVPAKALATAAQTGKYEAEGWRLRKDGSSFWASVVINAIHDPGGRLLGFAKITRDQTEKRASEERLRQAQKMEVVGQLTGGVAHDFNNLLTVIMGNIEALQRRLSNSGDASLDRLTDSALLATERAALLVNQLLAFSRRQSLEPKSISVNALISGISEMLRRTLGETIHIETVLDEDAWPVYADVNQLESALLNLAINARDAMPEGGNLTIEVANVFLDEPYASGAEIAPGQYVGIFVSDTGAGMTPEVAAQAFDPFFTTKEMGKGTGLGLSQVYGFIKQSGGHVKIHSKPGNGTTMKLYLPRYSSAETSAGSRRTARAIAHGRGETILVVEDDANVRAFTAETLRELRYNVIEAKDGASGLRSLDAHRDVKLLFTDVGLPRGMTGRQLADEARRRRPDLKVLFSSGYTRSALSRHNRLDPGVELLPKPFTYATLAARIRHLLDGR